jgi:transcription elongation factor Elf1
MEPFKCPHCGGHNYVIVLSGCQITGGTLEEVFEWDAANSAYVSSGSILMESESVENEAAQAVCSNCEKDVSDEVAAYEESLPQEVGPGPGVAEA